MWESTSGRPYLPPIPLGGALYKETAAKCDRPLVDSHMRHVALGRTESRFERGPSSRNRLRHATVTSRSGTLALAGSCERLGPSVISIVPRRVPERERRAAVVRVAPPPAPPAAARRAPAPRAQAAAMSIPVQMARKAARAGTMWRRPRAAGGRESTMSIATRLKPAGLRPSIGVATPASQNA